MLLDLDKVTLELIRGDTFELALPLNSGTREEFIPYYLQPDDFLYVGIMKPGQPFEHAEVRVQLNHWTQTDAFGNPVLYISSTDSALIEPGKYYISIKFKSKNIVNTLIDNKIFFVTGSDPCC